jgi:hypothetical protein
MFRRAETRERDALLRDTRAINDKVRLLARLGTALIEARKNGADLQEAVASAIGWDKLARGVEEAQRLARPDKTDLPALAARAWPVLHRLRPLFLGSLRFHAVPAAAATLRAIELLRAIYENGGQKWPPSLPTSFLSANTSPPSTRARARARGGSENQRPWPADKVERWALEELLTIKEGTSMSALAWTRQPPGVPGHRALARLIEHAPFSMRSPSIRPAPKASIPNACASSRARGPASPPSICGSSPAPPAPRRARSGHCH